MAGQEKSPGDSRELDEVLVLEGAAALRLLAHQARQRVIAEIYDGHEMTATEAAELCGLTPSAMSYHLRMLEKAGVLVGIDRSPDGRERRYRRAARRFEVHGARQGDGRVHLKATVGIWVDSLVRAVNRWLEAGSPGSGGLSTESFRLTPQENDEMLARLRAIFREYGALSEGRGEDYPHWETYWAHVPRSGHEADGTDRP